LGTADRRVSLFVTCLVDQFFPQVGEATVKILRRLGCRVDFPQEQTCCGQPAFNSGFQRETRDLARRFLEVFRDSQYIVAPSGSCISMVKVFYPTLFRHDPPLYEKAVSLARRTFELSEFLVKVLGVRDVGASFRGRVTYHASCHLLRELGISQEPRELIRKVKGAELVEMANADICCGFGGTFSIKYPEISQAMLEDKLRGIQQTGAQALVSCDGGCLMHLGGALSRRGMSVKPLHLAELLAQEE